MNEEGVSLRERQDEAFFNRIVLARGDRAVCHFADNRFQRVLYYHCGGDGNFVRAKPLFVKASKG